MKRHIIVYYGKQNSGKTTTLSLLHNMLALALPQCNNQPCPIPSPDFCSHFLTKGYVICISTGGDDASAILRGLEYFEQHQGHILITADRTFRRNHDVLNEYIECNQEVKLLRLKAQYADALAEQELANMEQASKLYQTILSTLNILI